MIANSNRTYFVSELSRGFTRLCSLGRVNYARATVGLMAEQAVSIRAEGSPLTVTELSRHGGRAHLDLKAQHILPTPALC